MQALEGAAGQPAGAASEQTQWAAGAAQTVRKEPARWPLGSTRGTGAAGPAAAAGIPPAGRPSKRLCEARARRETLSGKAGVVNPRPMLLRTAMRPRLLRRPEPPAARAAGATATPAARFRGVAGLPCIDNH